MVVEGSRRERSHLKPNAELRKALDEADKCMTFFNEGKFIDYFQSLNEVYLDNRGEIVGPATSVGGFSENTGLENKLLLELEQTTGEVTTTLEWKHSEGERNLRKYICISLYYHNNTDCFELSLFASTDFKFGNEQESGLLNTVTSLQRNFILNPESGLVSYVDDLLLTFTSELFEAGIL
ncbi:MAG: hypothetical protein ABH819_03130 [Patescibacteria group bacterium]